MTNQGPMVNSCNGITGNKVQEEKNKIGHKNLS